MSDSTPLDPWQLSRDELFDHVATHEAGHTVVGLVSSLQLVRVSIGARWPSRPDGLLLGGSEFVAPDGDQNLLAKQKPEKMAVVLLAGATAEQVVLGAYLRNGWVEDLRIMRIGLRWTESVTDAPRRAALTGFVNDARRLVVENASAIQRVASSLRDASALTHEQVQQLL